MTDETPQFSLREKKSARTKIALAEAFMRRLRDTRLADISIKEVCAEVEVAEGTFYNYFPQKSRLVCFFKQLAMHRVVWEARHRRPQPGPLELIEGVFDSLAKDIEQPFLFYEVISLFTADRVTPNSNEPLTDAEKFYAFPNHPGMVEVSVLRLEDFLLELIAQAREEGRLDLGTDDDTLVQALMSTLVGLPLVIEEQEFSQLRDLYRRQLALLWQSIAARSGEERP